MLGGSLKNSGGASFDTLVQDVIGHLSDAEQARLPAERADLTRRITAFALADLPTFGERLAEVIAAKYHESPNGERFIQDPVHKGPLLLDQDGHIVSVRGASLGWTTTRPPIVYIESYRSYSVLTGPLSGKYFDRSERPLPADPAYRPGAIAQWSKRLSRKGRDPGPKIADFVIITALEEERDAVLAKLPEPKQLAPSQQDIRVYYSASIDVSLADGSVGAYTVVVVTLLNMGRVEAANATSDAIRRWHPRYVILVGIAGGISESGVGLGDVLISDQVVDYELQKLTPDGPKVRYSVHRADPRLLGAAQNFSNRSWLGLVEQGRPQAGSPKRVVGPIATGDKVIAVNEVLERYRDDWPKLIGVEMEAGGAASASFQAPHPPGFFMVRGVSDLANSKKDTDDVRSWRSYACDVAASYTIALLSSGPVPVVGSKARGPRPLAVPHIVVELEEPLAVKGGTEALQSIVSEIVSLDRDARPFDLVFHSSQYQEKKATMSLLEARGNPSLQVLDQKSRLQEELEKYEVFGQPVDQLLTELVLLIVRNFFERQRVLDTNEIAGCIDSCLAWLRTRTPFFTSEGAPFAIFHLGVIPRMEEASAFTVRLDQQQSQQLVKSQGVASIYRLTRHHGLMVTEFPRRVLLEQILPGIVLKYLALKYSSQGVATDDDTYFDLSRWGAGLD